MLSPNDPSFFEPVLSPNAPACWRAGLTPVSTSYLTAPPPRSRLQFSPNTQSGKYNEMNPILIGTAVSEVSYTNFIALVPSRQTFVGRERAHKSRCNRLQNPGRKQKFLPASSLMYRNIPQNALSLLENYLNFHHFGM